MEPAACWLKPGGSISPGWLNEGWLFAIVAQDRPAFRAAQYPELIRTVSFQEYREAVQYALELGICLGTSPDRTVA